MTVKLSHVSWLNGPVVYIYSDVIPLILSSPHHNNMSPMIYWHLFDLWMVVMNVIALKGSLNSRHSNSTETNLNKANFRASRLVNSYFWPNICDICSQTRNEKENKMRWYSKFAETMNAPSDWRRCRGENNAHLFPALGRWMRRH